VTLEDETMNSLKKGLESSMADAKCSTEMRIVIDAPITSINSSLIHFGLLNRKGHPQCLHTLVDWACHEIDKLLF